MHTLFYIILHLAIENTKRKKVMHLCACYNFNLVYFQWCHWNKIKSIAYVHMCWEIFNVLRSKITFTAHYTGLYTHNNEGITGICIKMSLTFFGHLTRSQIWSSDHREILLGQGSPVAGQEVCVPMYMSVCMCMWRLVCAQLSIFRLPSRGTKQSPWCPW